MQDQRVGRGCLGAFDCAVERFLRINGIIGNDAVYRKLRRFGIKGLAV